MVRVVVLMLTREDFSLRPVHMMKEPDACSKQSSRGGAPGGAPLPVQALLLSNTAGDIFSPNSPNSSRSKLGETVPTDILITTWRRT
jgi:hypothetical protein